MVCAFNMWCFQFSWDDFLIFSTSKIPNHILGMGGTTNQHLGLGQNDSIPQGFDVFSLSFLQVVYPIYKWIKLYHIT